MTAIWNTLIDTLGKRPYATWRIERMAAARKAYAEQRTTQRRERILAELDDGHERATHDLAHRIGLRPNGGMRKHLDALEQCGEIKYRIGPHGTYYWSKA